MILMEYASISSIIKSEEEEENEIVIDPHNCVCSKHCTFGHSNMFNNGYCHPQYTKSKIVL